jgi:predicted Rossmann fold nucleotide-binding protein DprA/Smf involved in DNA uptake
MEHPVASLPFKPTPVERVRQTLAGLREPVPVQQLRKLCGIRTAAVCAALEELSKLGEVSRDAGGYQLNSFPVSRPMPPQGNGNGKPNLCSNGG